MALSPEEKRKRHAEYVREWARKNPEKKAANDQASYLRHREKRLASLKQYALQKPEICRAAKRAYYDRNREECLLRASEHQKLPESKIRKKEWTSKQRLENVNFRLGHYIRTRIWWALKKNHKVEATASLLGCSIEHLKLWLTFYFQPGMSWSNYGQWHIDHIKPCARFDLSDPVQQKECFHYTNLQPLWAKDNLSKGAKYEDFCSP
jgi:Prasinovirus endonuclease VII